MYVVVQKLTRKTVNSQGNAKCIEPYSYIDFDGSTAYKYRHSEERFERKNNTAYKVTVRRSYRENGQVKQQQWSLFTASYYDLLEFCIDDFMTSSKVDKIIKEAEINVADFWDMVYLKVQPIIDQIRLEYEATEEFKAECKNRRELREYHERERKFKDQYGECFYNHIYDFYGNLMNEELLEQVKSNKKAQDDYYSRYYENYKSNYNSKDYQKSNDGISIDGDKKARLKKIYKKLSAMLHPDNPNGSSEAMQMLNELKEALGI